MTGITGSTDVKGAGHLVRNKEHSGEPMTIDQASSEMELVGPDFSLRVTRHRR